MKRVHVLRTLGTGVPETRSFSSFTGKLSEEAQGGSFARRDTEVSLLGGMRTHHTTCIPFSMTVQIFPC